MFLKCPKTLLSPYSYGLLYWENKKHLIWAPSHSLFPMITLPGFLISCPFKLLWNLHQLYPLLSIHFFKKFLLLQCLLSNQLCFSYSEDFFLNLLTSSGIICFFVCLPNSLESNLLNLQWSHSPVLLLKLVFWRPPGSPKPSNHCPFLILHS